MSYKVFFDFSSGLKEPLHAPKGKLERILKHVDWTEGKLEIKIDECAECGQIGGPLIKCSKCGALLCDPLCHIDGMCGERCWHAGAVREALGIPEPEEVDGA